MEPYPKYERAHVSDPGGCEVKIEKGVPIPSRSSRSRNASFDAIDWSLLEIGDSFLIDAGSSGGLKKRARAAGIEIEIRTTKYNETRYGGKQGRSAVQFRIWRVK
jgi:hypothetical protein